MATPGLGSLRIPISRALIEVIARYYRVRLLPLPNRPFGLNLIGGIELEEDHLILGWPGAVRYEGARINTFSFTDISNTDNGAEK